MENLALNSSALGFDVGEETFRPAFALQDNPMISYGLPFAAACSKHLRERLNCERAFLIASRSLATQSSLVQDLERALGKGTLVGTRVGVSSHTPVVECNDIVNQVRKLHVDCLITLGAGSVTDCAKVVRFALANAAFTTAEILTLWGSAANNPARRASLAPPTMPLICLPTSLSGAELRHIAGATEPQTRRKRIFEPHVYPEIVILDPDLCMTTPRRVWLSTGVRSIDHCVESVCSLNSTEDTDVLATRGLLCLVQGLLEYYKLSKQVVDAEIRGHLRQALHNCQMGAVESMHAVARGVSFGASHGIGHQLGPLGVPHGETSCILLPAVCRYNQKRGANTEKQERLLQSLMKLEAVSSVTRQTHIGHPLSLADVLEDIIRALGMPRTLREVGINRDQLEILAENSLQDPWIQTNPAPLCKEDVIEILVSVFD